MSSPLLWGRYVWPIIHLQGMRYDTQTLSKEERASISTFMTTLPSFLPCPACQPHAAAYIKRYPPPLKWSATEEPDQREKEKEVEEVEEQRNDADISSTATNPPGRPYNLPLFCWTVQFHNDVNRRTGKSQYSLQEAWLRFQQTFFHGFTLLNVNTHNEWQKIHSGYKHFLQKLVEEQGSSLDEVYKAPLSMVPLTEQAPHMKTLFRQHCELIDDINRLRAFLQSKGVKVLDKETQWFQQLNQAMAFIQKQEGIINDLRRKEAQLNRRLSERQNQLHEDNKIQIMIYCGLAVCVFAIALTTFFVFRKGCELNVNK